jgi:hypothetical protein
MRRVGVEWMFCERDRIRVGFLVWDYRIREVDSVLRITMESWLAGSDGRKLYGARVRGCDCGNTPIVVVVVVVMVVAVLYENGRNVVVMRMRENS